MKSYDISRFSASGQCVCALGCFDGVHIGHSALIGEARAIAHKLSLPVAVWSFEAPPKNYFSKEKVGILTLKDEKRLAMRRLGVDIFVNVPLDSGIFSLSPHDFFSKVLLGTMRVKHVVCGFNYRFGKGGVGDTALLRELCDSYGIGLSVIPPVRLGELTVSSSEIRRALSEGRVDDAADMIGRPYSLRAKVCDGQHLGRKLGFPTLNQSFFGEKQVPKNGVYLSRITFGGLTKYGITNVGLRPTVDGTTLCAETNVFDFTGDLYGKTVTVELLRFIRPEQKFSSVDELSDRVHSDIATAKSILSQIK